MPGGPIGGHTGPRHGNRWRDGGLCEAAGVEAMGQLCQGVVLTSVLWEASHHGGGFWGFCGIALMGAARLGSYHAVESNVWGGSWRCGALLSCAGQD